MNHRSTTLRTLLGAAALAALITAAALGTLLLVTAGSARSVVETAQRTHDRVQAYTLLISTVRSFQNASYSDAHLRTSASRAERDAAHTGYRDALAAAVGLPRTTPEEQALGRRIEAQGRAVEAHLADTMEIVARIDRIWQTQGRRAAGLEAEQAARPFRDFVNLLETEIVRGDEEIAAATQRALTLGSRVLVACIIGLCFAAASWALIHILQKALQQVQADLERAVRERTEELQRANQELSASDGRRRAFLADIGHELRTPLTIIRGEAQVALRTMNQPGFSPQEAFERIIEHTHDLSRMAEDLFLIARAEAGGLPMQRRRVDLRELTLRVAADFEALATDMGAAVHAVPGTAVPWDVDPDRLRRALAALVDNALRHTRQGVQVVIEARATARGAQITVSDDGPGVDPVLVPELFQRFRRGHTRGEGSGLGLSLVRALVEAQSGRARLENRAEGGAQAILEFESMHARTIQAEEKEYEPAAG